MSASSSIIVISTIKQSHSIMKRISCHLGKTDILLKSCFFAGILYASSCSNSRNSVKTDTKPETKTETKSEAVVEQKPQVKEINYDSLSEQEKHAAENA